MNRPREKTPTPYPRTLLVYVLVIILSPLTVQVNANAEILEQLISSTLLSHPAARAQGAIEESAQADRDSARQQFYPTMSFSVEGAHTTNADTSYQGDNKVSILRLEQPLWTGGRLTAGLKKADAGVALGKAALDEVRQQLALRVVQAYGEWLVAQLKMRAHDKSVETHIQLRDQVGRRIGEGASSESDLIFAVSRLQSVTSDRVTTLAQRDTALAHLRQLVGHPLNDSMLNATLATPRPLDGDAEALLERALEIDPTIQKAQAQAEVQKSTIAERRANLSPDIYLRVERQYGNYTYNNLPPENRIFVGLNSHFGAGLSVLSNIKGAQSQYQAALEEIESQRRTISEQILSDYILATSSANRLNALQASMKASEQVSESYNRQFLAGRKTWIDVMNAARELSQAEIQIADTQASQIIATWRLAIHTQGVDFIIGVTR